MIPDRRAKSESRRRRPGRLAAAVSCAVSLTFLAGCEIYRVDVQQGQESAVTEADKLHVGMTSDEVFRMMGSPLISGSFRGNRWDYVYSVTPGGGDVVVKRRVSLVFEDDQVVEIIRSEVPDADTPEQ